MGRGRGRDEEGGGAEGEGEGEEGRGERWEEGRGRVESRIITTYFLA